MMDSLSSNGQEKGKRGVIIRSRREIRKAAAVLKVLIHQPNGPSASAGHWDSYTWLHEAWFGG
jgi:hypothetical protein